MPTDTASALARVNPVPSPNVDEILRWFRALDAQDLSNALLGAATVGIVGCLLCVGLLLVFKVTR